MCTEWRFLLSVIALSGQCHCKHPKLGPLLIRHALVPTGDPAKLIHHLGLGVWAFLASPASGLVEGARRGAPERIAAGMLAGTRGLIANTVYAFSNATAKMSGTARKVGLSPYCPSSLEC